MNNKSVTRLPGTVMAIPGDTYLRGIELVSFHSGLSGHVEDNEEFQEILNILYEESTYKVRLEETSHHVIDAVVHGNLFYVFFTKDIEQGLHDAFIIRSKKMYDLLIVISKYRKYELVEMLILLDTVKEETDLVEIQKQIQSENEI